MGFFSKLAKTAKEISAGTRSAAPKAARPAPKPTARPAVKPVARPVIPKIEEDLVHKLYWPAFRYRQNGYDLNYAYDVSVLVTDEIKLTACLLAGEKVLSLNDTGDVVHVLNEEGDVIGTLQDRVEMLRDWITRGDPYEFGLKQFHEDGTLTARIAFYRDRKKGQDWREQTVVALTAFSSEAKQDLIGCCEVGQELQVHEDGDQVIVTDRGEEEMGKIPAKYAKRIIEEGVYGVFFEKTIETSSLSLIHI